ncbi:MAG: flagellin [Methanoregula sp.]|jgi:archaellin|nr:flagellin [Methanoregula sp.]
MGLKWQYLFLAVILSATILAAGCTDEEPQSTVQTVSAPVVSGQVLYVVGDVTGDGIPRGTIDTITITVGLAPGEPPVNMEEISIVYADAIRTETLIPVEGFHGNPPQGTWGILGVNGELGGSNNRLEYEEQFVIRINPKAPLVPRQLITVIIKPPEGSSLTIRRISPPTIIKENNILSPV